MGVLSELVAAFILLTRLPLGRFTADRPTVAIARSVWAFPLAGAAAGALGGAAYAGATLAGVPPGVGAVAALAVMVLFTGALHEDGLADSADGFGGGRTPEHKLEIMRDSRIGSFGAIALILSLAARWAAIAAIGRPLHVLSALVVAASLGRAGMVVLPLALGPARSDGLAFGLQGPDRVRTLAGFAIAILLAAMLLPPRTALRAIAGALVASLAVAWLARSQIGGYTGDVLGAASVVTECVAIGLIAAVPLGN
ncbi:MAG TPA: adenosylcobinamide-GDP ribazoletransferase [Acetobacteraceae bacterium]|nr:adenosylcobinamide-GDP ribazoletransferase [Acetobacteraceae bacterium]